MKNNLVNFHPTNYFMQNTTRRDFLKKSSLATAGLFLATPEWFKKHAIGVQLYTLRDLMRQDPEGTLSKVASLGYSEVEAFGYNNGKFFERNPADYLALLRKYDLKQPSGHYGLAHINKGWDKAIEDAKAVGQKFMVIAYLTDAERKSLDDYKKHAATFNEAARKCKSAGIQFAYHNHDFEFKDWNGQTGMDVLLNETDKDLVKFEMDIYWVKKAGKDPIALFDQHKHRFCLWHVKDMDNTDKKFFTEVGNGVIDFKQIFKNAKKSGMRHFFVEQDVSANPLASIEKSINYIKSNLV